jgi:hypothetical protein
MIRLSPKLAARCWHYGVELCLHYAQGGSPGSRAVSYRNAQTKIPLQAVAKIAECIFCLELGCDPNRLLKWDTREADSGADLTLDGIRYDVKASLFGSRYLLWPKAKNHIFEGKQFDHLVLVLVDADAEKHLDAARGYSAGFLRKEDFARLKVIAKGGHDLDPGTWHVHKDQLVGTDLLFQWFGRREEA